tara:strand:- start:1876 stop:2298 length:423 start_codon:yes stop_codon:yes gene_type:complete
MYGTIDGWANYVEERGITDQDITSANLPALVRASDYIKYHYVANFRRGFDENVPEVELATYEAACLENTTNGFFERTLNPSEAKVLIAVDSIRWEKVSANRLDTPDNSQLVPISTKIEMYLRPYMRFNSSVGLMSVGPRR